MKAYLSPWEEYRKKHNLLEKAIDLQNQSTHHEHPGHRGVRKSRQTTTRWHKIGGKSVENSRWVKFHGSLNSSVQQKPSSTGKASGIEYNNA
eukprot:CAMPEP_0118710542 /NCGR_PEP_ID=MMETSP0800-20121206/23448_1 /TAXON_ID=210618 ORGANISM="Striatella unipunctata, Strain CCMP2910" /NCGR_SAMPLE_ID=MMETSP0800 /ASSEMBLY_ACC=CAM_ASM_000638 /LENGTH=91 /DNA_ID=CAMNT_0006614753 /DNA_START=143 /DNA_END=414 /DNA_ORIENTATION=-